jgi:pSer/pThr/pTyr-binding forkhead associated (FHA) protein
MYPSKSGSQISVLKYSMHENCENYLIIESVRSGINKTMHILNFEASVRFHVGRAQTAEIRISDISVSRFHAEIYLCNDGTLTIVDNKSKFGTLKLI